MFKDLLRIIFPDLCIHCEKPLVGSEKHLCTHCVTEIPWTNHAAMPNNETEQRLCGRIRCEAAAALMTFAKGNVTQSIAHHIKYYGRTTLATQFGRILGMELKQSGRFENIDFIVPVPLHWFKKIRRGYNQCDYICQGISETLNIPILKGNLKRTKYTHSQTHKNRIERQKNMQSVFAIRHPEQFQGKHILLVDDTITTGSTFDGCYQALKSIPDLHISVAALGLVKQH